MHDDDGELVRYGVKRIDGALTLCAATPDGDVARAIRIDVTEDLRGARVRLGVCTPEGMFIAGPDVTVEAICRVEAIESAEQLPLFDDDDSGIHVLGFGSSSAPLLCADLGDEEAA